MLEFTTLALTPQCCKSASENDRHGAGGRGDNGDEGDVFFVFVPYDSGINPSSSSSSIVVSRLFIATASANVLRLVFVGLLAIPPPPIPWPLSKDFRPLLSQRRLYASKFLRFREYAFSGLVISLIDEQPASLRLAKDFDLPL